VGSIAKVMMSPTRRKKLASAKVSEDFKRHSRSIAKQLKERDQDRVWVIDPRESKLLSLWDGITSIALLYTATLTPYEVGFLPAATAVDAWFITNRLLDGIFVIDMALQFCVVYQKYTDSNSDHDAAWVTERRTIIRHYFFGWFWFDLLSIAPSIFDIVPVVLAAQGQDVGEIEKLSGFRAIRALRLIKLVRLIRASRLLIRWQSRVGLSHGTITMCKIVGTILVSAHWYACIIALQALLHDDPAVTWLGLQGHCKNVPVAQTLEAAQLAKMGAMDIFAHQCEGLGAGAFYVAAFSWSAIVITGLGGTDLYPSADSAETIIVTILVIFGALMWAKVLATFCDLATNSDPSAIEYRQALDDLNRFCRDHALEPDLKRRLRQYFHQRKHVMMSRSASNVIHKMSTSLQIEVVVLVHSHWLKKIWFLDGAETACLVQLALRMEPCVFAPSELPEETHLYIIHRGIVMHGLKVLTSGRMWGEELILLDDRAHHASTIARCMTYVEVYSISRTAFFKVTNAFDGARRLVRRRAVLVIARRALVRLVRDLRKKKDEGDGRSFLELVLDAANSAKGERAKVIAIGEGGAGFHSWQALNDEICATNANVDALRAETGALRDGLNLLLGAQGLPQIPRSSTLAGAPVAVAARSV